jgi:hypothetical protein
MPIHGRKVDILQFDRWTWGAIGPTDMSTDKALDILCSRQLFHQRHFPPDVDDPPYNTTCCVIHRMFYCAT